MESSVPALLKRFSWQSPCRDLKCLHNTLLAMYLFGKIHVTDFQQMVTRLRDDRTGNIASAIWRGLETAKRSNAPSPGDIVLLDNAKHARILITGTLEHYEYVEFSSNKGCFYFHDSKGYDFFSPALVTAVDLSTVHGLVTTAFGDKLRPTCSFLLVEADIAVAAACLDYAGEESGDNADMLLWENKPVGGFMAVLKDEQGIKVFTCLLPSAPWMAYHTGYFYCEDAMGNTGLVPSDCLSFNPCF